MFAYPDFYKVAVSSAGNHDHRLDKATWVERYMGLLSASHYVFSANQNHAQNLQGKLLLIHGDMDENVHVASTLVVVDALIKANKDFDLLICPISHIHARASLFRTPPLGIFCAASARRRSAGGLSDQRMSG